VMKLDGIFYRAVTAALHVINLNGIDQEMGLQKLPGSQRQVCHLIEIMRRLLPEPLIYLLGTKGLIAVLNEKGLQVFKREFPNIAAGNCFDHRGLKLIKRMSPETNKEKPKSICLVA